MFNLLALLELSACLLPFFMALFNIVLNSSRTVCLLQRPCGNNRNFPLCLGRGIDELKSQATIIVNNQYSLNNFTNKCYFQIKFWLCSACTKYLVLYCFVRLSSINIQYTSLNSININGQRLALVISTSVCSSRAHGFKLYQCSLERQTDQDWKNG